VSHTLKLPSADFLGVGTNGFEVWSARIEVSLAHRLMTSGSGLGGRLARPGVVGNLMAHKAGGKAICR
jgi:hypothetical protein